MILVNTPVWVDHLQRGNNGLAEHLLAAVLLTPGSTLWTLDKRLHEASTRIGAAMGALH